MQTLVREGSPLVKLRNSAYLRLRLPTVPFALGEAVELQHDVHGDTDLRRPRVRPRRHPQSASRRTAGERADLLCPINSSHDV